MTDETKLQQDATRGTRARALLENDILSEAFQNLEAAYIAKWRVTPANAGADREKLFLAVNIIGKVREQIELTVAHGNVAQTELNRMAEDIQRVAERRKRFGTV